MHRLLLVGTFLLLWGCTTGQDAQGTHCGHYRWCMEPTRVCCYGDAAHSREGIFCCSDDLPTCCAPNTCCAPSQVCCQGECCDDVCCGDVCCASGEVCCNGACKTTCVNLTYVWVGLAVGLVLVAIVATVVVGHRRHWLSLVGWLGGERRMVRRTRHVVQLATAHDRDTLLHRGGRVDEETQWESPAWASHGEEVEEEDRNSETDV